MTLEIKTEFKIVFYVLFIISLFVIESLTVYLLIFTVLCLLLFRVPFKKIKAGWLPISTFLLFTFISNVLNRPGRILFSAGSFAITEEGVQMASVKTLRVLFMIGGAKILMASAGTEEIVDALGRLLKPLERTGLPVKDFFHTMGLTVKCFPVLKDMAVDAYNENVRNSVIKGFRGRARAISLFLLPLFIKSIQSPELFFEKTETNAD